MLASNQLNPAPLLIDALTSIMPNTQFVVLPPSRGATLLKLYTNPFTWETQKKSIFNQKKCPKTYAPEAGEAKLLRLLTCKFVWGV